MPESCPVPEPPGERRDSARPLHRFDRWLYRGGRPNRLARLMNRMSASVYSTELVLPNRLATLEVPGRRTGRIISFPVVVAEHEGDRYLVSMLGQEASWCSMSGQPAGGPRNQLIAPPAGDIQWWVPGPTVDDAPDGSTTSAMQPGGTVTSSFSTSTSICHDAATRPCGES